MASSTISPPSSNRWDRALSIFLKNAGLAQTLIGLENDMMVMNADWEAAVIPPALQKLQDDLRELSQNDRFMAEPLEDRKLAYNSGSTTSPKQMIREISDLIAKNRARNNISNRHEFLRKRASADTADMPTCARTDAIPVNRDIQMKYGVARNEGGPLMRTVKFEQNDSEPSAPPGQIDLLERYSNLEEHLAVRYVPGTPASLIDRIKYLEDHIIKLERDHPPWAALHFNQPNRGWPPPPRTTPLIIPSHLTSDMHAGDEPSSELTASGIRTKVRMKKSSSLHRAVVQKLEVKKALAGED